MVESLREQLNRILELKHTGTTMRREQILHLIIERVKGIENPYTDEPGGYEYHNGFFSAIQAVKKLLEEGDDGRTT